MCLFKMIELDSIIICLCMDDIFFGIIVQVVNHVKRFLSSQFKRKYLRETNVIFKCYN